MRTLSTLTADAAAGAILDAWGMSRKDMAVELGVNVATISLWRRSPLYIEARATETGKVIADAKNRMQRVRQTAFDLREDMYAELSRMLKSTDENGNPNEGIRLEALKLIQSDKAALSDFGETVEINANVHGAVFHVVEGAIKDGTPALGAGEVFVVEDAEVEDLDP